MTQIAIRRPTSGAVALFARLCACLGVLALLLAGGPAAAALPVWGVSVKATYPHDPRAYTEGLLYLKGDLIESTGQWGRSSVRRVRLKDGAVLQSTSLAPNLFGEGVVNWGDELISLTWRDQVGFRWDLKTLKLKTSFSYPGEGWALTTDGKVLFMSDGSPALRVLDPATFREIRRIRVSAEGRPVFNLNELEWVKGEIWANIWQTSRIARIDPSSGQVRGWIDLGALPEARSLTDPDSVLNGIAYDAKGDRVFVTGKNWPHLYQIELRAPRR